MSTSVSSQLQCNTRNVRTKNLSWDILTNIAEANTYEPGKCNKKNHKKTQKTCGCFLKSSIMVNYNTSLTYIVSAVPKKTKKHLLKCNKPHKIIEWNGVSYMSYIRFCPLTA